MKQSERERLMRKYGIKEVGGGTYGEGFFDALRQAEKVVSRTAHALIEVRTLIAQAQIQHGNNSWLQVAYEVCTDEINKHNNSFGGKEIASKP